ncbi:MAG: hypothetical protein U1F51_19855 [Burkholderiales bacterium]
MSSLCSKLLQALVLGLVLCSSTGPAIADPYPPTWGGGAAHFPPVAWPTEPADIAQCGHACGDWKLYSRFQAGVTDPRVQDPSNGGTAPQNYVNVASSCVDKTYPSIYYFLYRHPTDAAQDVLMFRWRVEQIANTYATGPSAGNYSSSDPWSSALWTVLFDIDGDGYRDIAAHLNGSSGDPSHAVDMLAGIWGNIPTQSIDYVNDPSIKLIAHNPTAFVSGTRILNFQNSLTPVTTWPAGSNVPGTTYDYGTSRARVVTSSPCNEYFVDYQIPIRMLDASPTGPNPSLNGPKITRSTPISMLFCTANSLNNPFQKDCTLQRAWVADASKPAPFGDYISFDQPTPYAQPIVSSVTATPPSTCPGSYALEAKVQDTLHVDANGVIVPTVKGVRFYYWHDVDGDGTTAGDGASAWTLAASATLKPGTLSTWIGSWNATGLPKGQYLIGVQAVDDPTLHDDGTPDAPVANRTYSYVTGSADPASLGQIYINPWTWDGATKTWASAGAGDWLPGQAAAFPAHAIAPAPGATENWYGNPAVTGVQTALIDVAVNACGTAPTLVKTASPAAVATGGTVTFTVTLANATGSPVTLERIDDPLPSGFAFGATQSVTLGGAPVAPSSAPVGGATGTVSWLFGAGLSVPNNQSLVLAFTTTASPIAGRYANVATATTDAGAVSSAAASVSVDAARVSLAKTPDSYAVAPGGQVAWSLAYANDSSVPVTSATLVDTLPSGASCVSYSIDGAPPVPCSGASATIVLGTLAPGASGTVVLVAEVDPGYSSSSLTNQASLDAIAPDGTTHATANASSTVAVSVAAPAFTLTKTSDAALVAENGVVTWTIGYANVGTGAATSVVISDPLPSGFGYVSSTPVATSAPTVGQNGTVTWNLGSVPSGGSGSVQVAARALSPYVGAANPATNTATIDWAGGTPVTASTEVGVAQTGTVCRNYYLEGSTVDVGVLSGNLIGTATALSGPQRTLTTTVPSGATADVSTFIAASGSPVETEVARFYQDPVSGQLVTFDGSSTLGGQIYYTKSGVANQVNAGMTLTARVYDYDPSNGAQTLLGSASYVDNGSPTPPVSLSGVAPAGSLQKGHRLLIVVTALMNANKSTTVNLQVNSAQSYVRICAPAPANLVLQKKASAASVDAQGTGRQVTYTIGYANTSDVTAATGVTISDTLPAGTTFVSTSSSPAATTTSTPAVGSGGTVTWNFGSIAGGASGSVTLVVALADDLGAATSIDNTATIASTQTATVSASAATKVLGSGPVGSAQLVVTKTANPTTAVAGDTVTWTLTVVNVGTGAAANVVVTDDFPDPAWATYGGCTATKGSCGQSPPGTLVWNVGVLAAGAHATATLDLDIAATGVPAGVTLLDNTASVTDDTYCTGATPPAGCTSANARVTVNGVPSLSITKTSAPAQVAPGGTITYTLVVTNGGSSAAADVVVTDPIPSYLLFAAITGPGPGTARFDPVANRVVFAIGTLAAGASATVAFTATVTALPPGDTTLDNLASVIASNAPSASANASSSGHAAASLALIKAGPSSLPFPATVLTATVAAKTTLPVASAAFLVPGDRIRILNGADDPIVTVTSVAGQQIGVGAAVSASAGSVVIAGARWSITWRNDGDAVASAVTITDTLPAGWLYAGATPSPTAAPTVGTPGSVTWTIGAAAPGESGVVEVVAIPTASGASTNTATVSSPGVPAAQASAEIAVGGLVVAKSTSTPVRAAGTIASYTIVITNSLASPVTGFSATDSLPAGFTYRAGSGRVAGSPVEPTFDPLDLEHARPTWSALSVAGGATLTITFDADIATTTGPGTYQNAVELGGVPPTVGVTAFDPLATPAEDVTVLASGTGLVEGVVFRDQNGNGTYDPDVDLPLAGVRVDITGGDGAPYVEWTDAAGRFRRVVAAGTAQVDVDSSALGGGLVLAPGNTDPASVEVPDGGSARKDTGYVLAAALADTTSSISCTPTSVPVGSPVTCTLTCSNSAQSPAAAADVDCRFTGTLPPGAVSTGCPATNATLAIGASISSCSVSFTPAAPGPVTLNATVTASNDADGSNNASQQQVLAIAPPQISKAFGAPYVSLGGTTTLVFTLVNPNTASALSGVAFNDPLPAGLTLASPPQTNSNCIGVVDATAGGASITLSAGSLAANASCTISVVVVAIAVGPADNVSGNVTSIEGGTGGFATASLEVGAAPPREARPSLPVPGLSPAALLALGVLIAFGAAARHPRRRVTPARPSRGA